jgi:hypothetical protein
MANKSLYLDKKELADLMNKFKEVGLLAEDFNKEVELTAERIKDSARADFNSGAKGYLEGRGEETNGLASSIQKKTLKRKKGGSAFQVSAGGSGKEIMAYVEFGTRSKDIELGGITSVFGSEGSSYALRFKGSDNEESFSHTYARPYFFKNVLKEKKDLIKRVNRVINSIIKKR